MKRLFVILVACLAITSSIMAQEETGFGTSADLLIGYKNKTAQTILGYDFGYKLIPGLYLGAGPMVSASFGGAGSSFGGGGYGKIRFTIPLDYSVLPFIDGRVGYGYDFTSKTGGLLYAAGLGVRFNEYFYIGINCNISSSTSTSPETYIKGYEKRYNRVDKKYYNVPLYGKRNVDTKNTEFVPTLLFSVQF